MTTGTVKWFNPAKGFGFIEPEDGGNDAFVHISAVERAGLDGLTEGQKVSYELTPGQNGKSSAENLSLVEEPPKAPPPTSVGGGRRSPPSRPPTRENAAESRHEGAGLVNGEMVMRLRHDDDRIGWGK